MVYTYTQYKRKVFPKKKAESEVPKDKNVDISQFFVPYHEDDSDEPKKE